ncbi:hypothetical protein AB0K60_37255 [Thermopolyspora sp. NPDC052614]|uniref:hypothetical protein n=1 Tax=Thermopolyspora sp. NPDC052614 TaxID=3155682 RepID=UPI00341844E1
MLSTTAHYTFPSRVRQRNCRTSAARKALTKSSIATEIAPGRYDGGSEKREEQSTVSANQSAIAQTTTASSRWIPKHELMIKASNVPVRYREDLYSIVASFKFEKKAT